MNLPFVLDVVIGLVFIFLILSLLASEIQELLTALLQWRAKHLKEAIEVLLAGEIETQHEAHIQQLVSKLYDDPLIKNINQGAKGRIARMLRVITHWLPGNHRGRFGANHATGPSYIASETFATSLLERVGLASLIKKLVEVRLEKFAKRIVGTYQPKLQDGILNRVQIPEAATLRDSWDKGRIRLIAESVGWDVTQDENFAILVDEFDDILNDFNSGEAGLATSVERMGESLDAYISTYPTSESNPDTTEDARSEPNASLMFAKRLKNFKRNIFGERNERAIMGNGLRPTLPKIADLINQSSSTYQEVADAYKELVTKGKQIDLAVLPKLKDRLLATQVEVVEQLLVDKHLDKVRAQFKQANPKIAQELESKLRSNLERIHVAIDRARNPIRQRRGCLRRVKAWFIQQHRRITLSDLKALEKQRQCIIAHYFDRLSDAERQTLILDVLNTLGDDELYGEVKDGKLVNFGLIEIALDKLTHEEYNQIINDAVNQCLDDLTILKGRNGWQDENFEQQKLYLASLYQNYQTYKRIQQILAVLPNSIKDSFAILARRAQTRIHQTEQGINQFREEVAVWFDRSMSRASGVYKRNAKGVAIVLGLLLATLSNVDAAFIVDRLSSDESLRQVVTENAISLESDASDNSQQPTGTEQTLDNELRDLKNRTNAVLEELALPIGWNAANLSQQLGCNTSSAVGELPSDWTDLYSYCLPSQSPSENALQNIFNIIARDPLSLFRILFGWLITGIAISMGAPFWFDLLGKVINVRNSGSKPTSVGNQSTTNPSASEIIVRQQP